MRKLSILVLGAAVAFLSRGCGYAPSFEGSNTSYRASSASATVVGYDGLRPVVELQNGDIVKLNPGVSVETGSKWKGVSIREGKLFGFEVPMQKP